MAKLTHRLHNLANISEDGGLLKARISRVGDCQRPRQQWKNFSEAESQRKYLYREKRLKQLAFSKGAPSQVAYKGAKF